eukprot:1835492-Prymnesium_polylepis.1
MTRPTLGIIWRVLLTSTTHRMGGSARQATRCAQNPHSTSTPHPQPPPRTHTPNCARSRRSPTGSVARAAGSSTTWSGHTV